MLYISFGPQDEALARLLAKALEAHGIRVWALWDVRPGESFDDAVAQKLQECSCVVVLVSRPRSGGSLRSELDLVLARRAQVPHFAVIPVLVGDTSSSELPSMLANFAALHAPAAYANDGDVRELAGNIARAVHAHVEQPSRSMSPPSPARATPVQPRPAASAASPPSKSMSPPTGSPRSMPRALLSIPGMVLSKFVDVVSRPFVRSGGDRALKVELGGAKDVVVKSKSLDAKDVRRVLEQAGKSADATAYETAKSTPDVPAAIPSPPARSADQVRFSAFAPPSVQAESAFVLDIWAYVKAQRADVLERATKRGKKVEVGDEGTVPLARGSVLSIAVEIDGLTCDPTLRSLTWLGEAANASFEVTVPAGAKAGTHVGKARITQDLIPLTTLFFEIEVGAATKASADLNGREERVRSVFVSYASPDRAEAARYKLDAQTLGIDAFVDAITLRAGADWEAALWSRIDSSDRLCLLWSQHAKQSPWVEQEWRHGLEKKGLGFIQPVPLVDPRDAEPPPELAKLQFNSVERMVIDYELGRKPPK